MIPEFDPDGLLPEGIHDCSLNELRQRFGSFQTSDRRPRLYQRFEELVSELRTLRMPLVIYVDGSFVTRNPRPNDVDLILALPTEWDLAAELSPNIYNLLSKNQVKKRFGFDMFAVREQTDE